MISSSLDILYLFCMIIQRYCCHEIVEHIFVYLTHLLLFYRSSIKHASATGGHMQTSLCGLCLQTWNAREHSTQHGVNEWRTGRCLELTKLFRVSGNINFSFWPCFCSSWHLAELEKYFLLGNFYC